MKSGNIPHAIPRVDVIVPAECWLLQPPPVHVIGDISQVQCFPTFFTLTLQDTIDQLSSRSI